MTNKSILLPEMNGVMFIGGRRGVGKSYLASTADNPKNVCFVDFEEKGNGIHYQLGFGAYHSLLPDANLYQNVLNVINQIEQDKFTVIIFDNVSILEDAMKAEAKKNASIYAKEFGLSQSNISTGRFGGASAVVNKLISYKISAPLHSKGVKLIIGTAHAKPFWASAGPIPNKWNILGADRWQDLAVLNLILVNGDNPPVPSAIVKKEQLGFIRFDEDKGEFETGRRLPYRIPTCTFKAIKNYLIEPANLDDPAKGEVVSEVEYAAYSDELTNEQLEMNKMALEIQQEEVRRQEKEEQELFNNLYQEQQQFVQSLAADKKGPIPMIVNMILAEVQEKYPELSKEDVGGMLS